MEGSGNRQRAPGLRFEQHGLHDLATALRADTLTVAALRPVIAIVGPEDLKDQIGRGGAAGAGSTDADQEVSAGGRQRRSHALVEQ